MTTGVGAAALSLFLTWPLGWLPFPLLSAMTILGILYSFRIVPTVWGHFSGLKKIKDIPASKSLSVALGWGGVTTLIPVLAEKTWTDPNVFLILLIICGLVYVRSGLFDILDIQGDLIVGKETLPILVGEKKTLKVLEGLGAATLSLLILLTVLGRIPGFGLSLLLPAAYLFVFLILFERKYALPGGIYFEALVEFTFILSGILALLAP